MPEKVLSGRREEGRGLRIARRTQRGDLKHLITPLKDLYNGALKARPITFPLPTRSATLKAAYLMADPRLIVVMKGDEIVGQFAMIRRRPSTLPGQVIPGRLADADRIAAHPVINLNGAGLLENTHSGGKARWWRCASARARATFSTPIVQRRRNDDAARDAGLGIDFTGTDVPEAVEATAGQLIIELHTYRCANVRFGLMTPDGALPYPLSTTADQRRVGAPLVHYPVPPPAG
jgi:hypothetical protein